MTDLPRWTLQEHQARGHHFDLRLEIGGVLVSWAVPKGPSTEPGVRRLAQRVDDHDLDQLLREGVDGPGRATIVWDTGTYELLRAPGRADTVAGALAAGHLVVRLVGHKLDGPFALLRTGGESDAAWLLLAMRGGDPRAGEITVERPESVLSGRSLADLLAG